MLNWKRLGALAGGVLAAIFIACFYIVARAGADSSTLWLAPSALNLQPQASITTPPASINGNEDCYATPGSPCVVATGYGFANTASAVKLDGTNTYYPVYSYVDNRQHFLGIPNSTTAISYASGPANSLYLYFNYNFSSGIKLSSIGAFDYYQMTRPPDGKLADTTGKSLAADTSSISFSENGEWMVVSQPYVAMLRVNLRTFEVQPFAPGFDYSIGLNPNPQTAITNDGRYAMVASKDFSRFSIYDLQNCTASVCPSRDLQSYLRSQISGYKFSTNVRFISNDMVSLYATSADGAANKTSRYILTTGSSSLHRQDLLALGDSFISGEGEFSYIPATDTEQNTCHVSPLSYPLLLGYELGFNAYHSVACSGATTKDIIDTSLSYKGQAKPNASRQNLEQKDLIYTYTNNFLQGYIDQLDFIKQYQPQNVLVSIGGNDIGFREILQSCTYPGTCYDTFEDRLELVQSIQRQFDNLAYTYSKLKQSGSPDSRVYIVGYPQIAKPGGDCDFNVHLDGDELVFAEELIDYLDSVIKNAAARAGVYYVDTEDAFYGHRMCEVEPGPVAMNGLTAGNDFPDKLGGPIGRESYHPNTYGHQLLENKILALTHNLTNPMPTASAAAAAPGYDGLPILNMPKSGRQIRTTEFDPGLAPDLVYRGTAATIAMSGSDHALAAGATLQAELHSTPLSLGSFKTDSTGSLSTDIMIPGTVTAGYHTIHFYGTDISGQPVDIYKTIYVAATADDIDGNGILDSNQACVGVDVSGQDYDKDGIDDACDGDITQPVASSDSASASVASQSQSQPGPSNTTSTSSSPEIQLASESNNSEQAVDIAPQVLAAQTSSQEPGDANASADNKNPQSSYLATGSIGFLILSSLGYFIKSRLS
jgi:hypothetical protein